MICLANQRTQSQHRDTRSIACQLAFSSSSAIQKAYTYYTSAVKVVKHKIAGIGVKMKNILLIHGANSSAASFNYLKAGMPKANYISLSYDAMYGFYFNLERMIDLMCYDKEYEVLSHSMGGLFALHLTQHRKIRKSVSIATPFAGVEIADWARYLIPQYSLFQDVHTRSLPIKQAKEIELNIPWLQIVTTRGNVPWMKIPNDGVVTASSMTCRKDVDYFRLNENHHEVMLSDGAVERTKSFLFPDVND